MTVADLLWLLGMETLTAQGDKEQKSMLVTMGQTGRALTRSQVLDAIWTSVPMNEEVAVSHHGLEAIKGGRGDKAAAGRVGHWVSPGQTQSLRLPGAQACTEDIWCNLGSRR